MSGPPGSCDANLGRDDPSINATLLGKKDASHAHY